MRLIAACRGVPRDTPAYILLAQQYAYAKPCLKAHGPQRTQQAIGYLKEEDEAVRADRFFSEAGPMSDPASALLPGSCSGRAGIRASALSAAGLSCAAELARLFTSGS